MKVDVNGVATQIQEAIRGPRQDELRYMVGEMARHILRLESYLENIRDCRNEFTGPSLDYMQGYRDGQEFQAKMARHALENQDCKMCQGTGSVDTGGQTPWGSFVTDACPYCEGSGRQ